jgi:hypothetical protein
MDLIREVLFELEKQDGSGSWIKVAIEGRSQDEINCRLLLLKDIGFLEAAVLQDGVRAIVQPIRLTWSGDEFSNAPLEERPLVREECRAPWDEYV